MNFCKDCKHFKRGGSWNGFKWPPTCHHPQLMFAPDPVHGHPQPADPYAERQSKDDESCGPDGAHFEQKPPQPERRGWWRA